MAKLRVAWRNIQVIHVALMVATAMYGGVLVAVTQQPQRARDVFTTDPQLMVAIFGAIALVILVGVIPLLRRKLLPERDRVGDGRTLELDGEIDPALQRVIRKLQPGLIATWALCEAVAVLGFVLGLLYHDVRYFLPFGGVALAAMIVFAPRLSLLDECWRVARRG